MEEIKEAQDLVGFNQMKSLLMDELAEASVASVDTILDDLGNESLSIGFDNGSRLILEEFYLIRRDELSYESDD